MQPKPGEQGKQLIADECPIFTQHTNDDHLLKPGEWQEDGEEMSF